MVRVNELILSSTAPPENAMNSCVGGGSGNPDFTPTQQHQELLPDMC